jgi:phosphoenolpyruvate carboxykinase (ATP)
MFSDAIYSDIKQPVTVHYNNSRPELYEMAIARGEAKVASTGALYTETGEHTGRSAGDKFIVCDATTKDTIWWDNNKSMTVENFSTLYADFMEHASGKHLFVQDLFGGADHEHRLPVRIYTEYAWQALFIQHLLIEPAANERADFAPEFTIMCLPTFQASPSRHGTDTGTVIAVDFARKLVLIGGTSYAGEIKKSVFTYLNYILTEQGVMPMHCSVNEGKTDRVSAVFFGLSGTGKTTLSADPRRILVGDDEHGWSENGLFNFEGGCYAKVIKLSETSEPEIHAAVNSWAAVLENVIVDRKTRKPDFDNGTLTENTRGAYPLEYIPNARKTGIANIPRNLVMLTADAFGIMPPIARLTPSQAMYHFMSGYTAKVAGTEKGVTEPQATFSACFGAPFMPRHPSVYGNLLRELINTHGVDCWLVNTGWSGGKYGVGQRMPINTTRALLNAALGGMLRDVEMSTDPVFGFEVPVEVVGVDAHILNPRNTWEKAAEYDTQAKKLVFMFAKNFEKFADHVDEDVLASGPHI